MKKLKRESIQILTSVYTIVYALAMTFITKYIQILSPPAQWIVMGIMILLPTLKLIAIFFNHRKLGTVSLLGMSIIWAVVAWLYSVHPVRSTGPYTSLFMMLLCFILIYRGGGYRWVSKV